MTRSEFWILNGASLLLSGLVFFEMYSSDQLEEAQNLARKAQAPILQAEEIQPLARRMVEAAAQGSGRDSALAGLLAKYGFQVAPARSTPESATPPAAAPIPNPAAP